MTTTTAKKPNWKKRILVGLFVAFNATIILWTATSEFSGKDNSVAFRDIKLNGWLLIPALLLFVIGFGAEIYKYIYMTKKLGEQNDWRVGARTVILGRYYDNITPAAVGGQPFQIHYMHTHGVKHGYDAIIPIFGLISTQIAFIFVAIFTYIFFGRLVDSSILGLGLLGLIFYAIFPVAIIIATFFPKTLESIIIWGVKLLAKIHIVKDKDEAIKKTEHKINRYTNCIKTIIKDKKLTAVTLLLSVVFHICITALPFFILKAFGGSMSFFTCFATILAITAAVYIAPTPGNSGFAEGSFFLVFSSLTTGYIFWAMLFWRFFTYYSYIILGLATYGLIAYEKKTGRNLIADIKSWLKTKFKSKKS